MRQKGFGSILVIVVVLVVAAGAFYLLRRGILPSSTSQILYPKQSSLTNTSEKVSFQKVSKEKLLFTGGYADATFTKLSSGTLVLYVNKFGTGASGYNVYTSTDGLDWKEYNGESLPSASTGRAVVFEDGVRFYYPGLQPIKPSDPPADIYSSFSKDGFSFTKETGTRISPKNGYYLEGPTVIKLQDGTYRMYFNENETASKEKRKGAIWGATSTDGLTWVRDEKVTIESTSQVENSPSDWPQALHPFILKRPDNTFLMFYNTHSKVYAAKSADGKAWEKLGPVGIDGADVDGYYLPDGNIRLYYGNFSPQTSGVIYTLDIKEVKI